MSQSPVLITGMHRSGTSLTANLLRNCGLFIGSREELIQADEVDNPAGYWEYADAVGYSDRLLESLNASWDQLGDLQYSDWLEKIDINKLETEALRIFEPLMNSPSKWGWKDPRASIFLPVWRNIFPDLKVVVCLRNPLEVAFSLSKRDRFHVDFVDGLALWRDYSEILESNIEGVDHIVTHYEALLYSPKEELERVCSFLGLNTSLKDIEQAAKNIHYDLYRGMATEQLLRRYPILPENLLDCYDRFVDKAGEVYHRIRMDNVLQDQIHEGVLLRLFPLITKKFDDDHRKLQEFVEGNEDLRNQTAQLKETIRHHEEKNEDLRNQADQLEEMIRLIKDEKVKQDSIIAKLNVEVVASNQKIAELEDQLNNFVFLEENYKLTLARLNLYEVQLSQIKKGKGLRYFTKSVYDWMFARVLIPIKSKLGKMFPMDSRSRYYLKKIYQKVLYKFGKAPQIFDGVYYLETNVDVAQSGVDPYIHYMTNGYLEGRKPHPLFDPNWYLSQNQDVLDANIEPFSHYLHHGWREGRSPHFLFDTQYYLSQYPDVYDSGLDPFTHFWFFGWKEGRNPNPSFDLAEYLSQHPELIEFEINPLHHYIGSGVRPPETPELNAPVLEDVKRSVKSTQANIGLPRTKVNPNVKRLRNLLSIENRIQNLSHRKPKSTRDDQDLYSAITKNLIQDSVVISLSQDDYIHNVGGVQIFVWDEQTALNHKGLDYVHLSPYYSKPRLAYRSEESYIRVIVNGKKVGVSTTEDTLKALKPLVDHGIHKLIIHHLLGFDIDWVNELVTCLGDGQADFWLHDNFSICPGYTLLRNDVTFCGAPPVESNACRLCVYGSERLNHHVPGVQSLFEHNQISVYAPSDYTMELWKEKSGLPYTKLEVLEHASIQFELPLKANSVDSRDPMKIVYLGNPIYYKGWEDWKRLLAKFGNDERYEFYHFGMNTDPSLPHKFVRTVVTKENRLAMVDVLMEHEIDVCFLWSICPESFSFTLYESMAAGCFVVAHKDSGNIQDTVRKKEVGEVFDSVDELMEKMTSDGLLEDVNRYQYQARTGTLKMRLMEDRDVNR